MDDQTKKGWREWYNQINKNLEFLERILHMEEPMSETRPGTTPEDQELKVMESRVKAAMDKCPAGKEILQELFYLKPKEEWKDITNDCYLKSSDITYGVGVTAYHMVATLQICHNSLTSRDFTVATFNPSTSPFIFPGFKIENARIWKRVVG